MTVVRENFLTMAKLLAEFSTPTNFEKIEKAANWMAASVQAGGKIISCGNGGSMADAMHFAEELTGRYRKDRPAIPAISIADPTHLSCVANDYGYEYVFSRYVEALGQKHDILLGISTSGNSKNVLLALEAAKSKGMKTIALTGKDGGKIAHLVDLEIRVPYFGFADRIQEMHIKIIHNLIELIEYKLFPELHQS